MSTPARSDKHLPDPKTRIYGDEQWDGWWHFPAALLLVTLVLIVAAALIQGTGMEGFLTLEEASQPGNARGASGS